MVDVAEGAYAEVVTNLVDDPGDIAAADAGEGIEGIIALAVSRGGDAGEDLFVALLQVRIHGAVGEVPELLVGGETGNGRLLAQEADGLEV